MRKSQLQLITEDFEGLCFNDKERGFIESLQFAEDDFERIDILRDWLLSFPDIKRVEIMDTRDLDNPCEGGKWK